MPMYIIQFKARPMPAHPKGNQYEGAFVTCWIQRDSQIEAETIARRMIADEHWMILGLEDSFSVTKGTHLPLGYTDYSYKMAFMYFGIFAALPALCLARLWRGRMAVLLLTALLPVSLLAAGVVARVEERTFIARYQDVGVGPTPRWTVSMHWLSYDREAQRLNGSD